MVEIIDSTTTELIRHNARAFLDEFARRQQRFDRYLCIDLATTGLNSQEDLIIDFGWCEVRGAVATYDNVLLDWTRPPYSANQIELVGAFEQLRYYARQRGQSYPYSVEQLQQEGVPALQGLQEIRKRLTDALLFGWPVVSHQGEHFDCLFLEHHLTNLDRNPGATPLEFPVGSVFDTGVIHKAAMLGEHALFHETMSQFAWRISEQPVRGLWNLLSLIQPYQIDSGVLFAESRAARMDYCAWLTHQLFERMRSLAAENRDGS